MMNKNNIPDFDLLAKYFAGECSHSETLLVEEWAKQNSYEYKKVYSIWNHFDNVNTPFDTDKALLQVNKKINRRNNFRKLYNTLTVAATIAVIVAIPFLFPINFGLKPSLVQIAPVDSVSNILLSDGTTVFVNRGTFIEYSNNFKKARLVKIKGEALFNVAKSNESSDFIVETSNVEILVVGTSFNVVSHSNSSYTEVTVLSGIVKVSDRSGDQLGLLTQKQRLIFNSATRETVINSIENLNDLYWQTKRLDFENATIIEVCDQLKRIFNVNFSIDIENPESFRITTSFENNSFDEIIRIIEITLDVKILQQADTIIVTHAS